VKTFVRLLIVTFVLALAVGQAQAPTPVTLRYANWNLGTAAENNLQRQLVAAYMRLNPHVRIELVDMAGGRWDEMLTTLAARGALPDVFMANSMPLYLRNGWLADLTRLAQASPDWLHVPKVLKDAVTFNRQVMGLPSAQFVMGYFVNHDLFEAAILKPPTYGVRVADFFAAVTALTDVRKGVLGLDEMEFIMGWYPSTQDPRLGWFSYDSFRNRMNYNSRAFRAGVARAGAMRPHTWQGLTEALRANFKSKGPWELFFNQEAGVRWDGGWAVPAYARNAAFKWDFMGIPGGNQAMVVDILVVSRTTANLAAAFDFARWMSFSLAGYREEARLARAAGVAMSRMPVSPTRETIDLYMATVGDRPGLRRALENLDRSLLESLAKVVPGYIDARWEGRPGIDIGEHRNVTMGFMLHHANDGLFKFEDFAARLETFANRILAEARAALGIR
jgi:ABC-type glycerol-3-phosphate transport system substrate-binding protein